MYNSAALATRALMLILYHLLTLQKRRRKRPCHPRRVLLPTRIYLAGFMTRGLPLRKRDYAHRHDSARASLRNVDCLHKAMGARAQRGARRKGTFFFFFLLHPSPTLQRYHWGPGTSDAGRPPLDGVEVGGRKFRAREMVTAVASLYGGRFKLVAWVMGYS